MRYLKLLAALVLFFAPVSVQADVKVGEPAPDFTLTDTNGDGHALSQYKGKYVVLEWFNYECPFVVKHYESGNMQKLQQEYTGKDVVWLSINSSAEGKQGQYAPEEMNKLASERGVKSTALLLDPDGKVGQQYGAKTTPHMFVIDPQGTLIYQGAIDDTPSADKDDVKTAKNSVKAALDAAMTGQPVAEPTTKSYGCSVKY
jgi:peroxiredoxin